MPLSEVLPALQQGTLDGVMSVLPVFTALRFYDAAKSIVETDHAAVSVVSVVSKVWFDKLPADQQAVIVEAGKKADKENYAFALDFMAKAKQTWTSNGGTIVKLSATEQTELTKLLRPIATEVTSKKPEEKALYELMAKAAGVSL